LYIELCLTVGYCSAIVTTTQGNESPQSYILFISVMSCYMLLM